MRGEHGLSKASRFKTWPVWHVDVYKQGLEHARQITDLVSVIIDDVDRSDRHSILSTSASNSGSIAEEIAKLAELRDKGILTDEEFSAQKAKLLS